MEKGQKHYKSVFENEQDFMSANTNTPQEYSEQEFYGDMWELGIPREATPNQTVK